jgi:hypothetical protein
MRYSYSLTLLPALAAASPMMQVGTIHNGAAPILSSTQTKEVPNSYMVVFKKHVKESHAKEHHEWVQSIHAKSSQERMELRKRSQFPVTAEIFDGLKHTYNIIGGMVGYSGHFDEETIEAIRRHPDVSTTPYTHSFIPSVISWGWPGGLTAPRLEGRDGQLLLPRYSRSTAAVFLSCASPSGSSPDERWAAQ